MAKEHFENSFDRLLIEHRNITKELLEATKDVFPFQMICKLQLGYNPKTRLKAIITKIEVVDGKDTDLHIDKPVYAIHLADVREEKF